MNVSEFQEYIYEPQELTSGNSVELYFGGPEIFPVLLRLIETAKYRILLQIYRFENDEIGNQVQQALLRAAERSCEIRIIYDYVGSLYTPNSFFETLRQGGAEVMCYHPAHHLHTTWRVFKRNHRKMLLVDSEVALIGGFNIADDYARESNEGGFLDLATEIKGPACRYAWMYFDQVWSEKGRAWVSKFRKKERRKNRRQNVEGDQKVVIAGNDHFGERWKIRREILYAFSKAKDSIRVMNPYFLPDPSLVRSLIEASERGVSVRVIIPRKSDVGAVDLGSTVVIQKLILHGIEVLRWPGFSHAKAIIIDEKWLSIGSFNFDYRSVFHNLELMVHIVDKACSEKLTHFFVQQEAKSIPVSEQEWKQMPFLTKLLAKFFYRMRFIL